MSLIFQDIEIDFKSIFFDPYIIYHFNIHELLEFLFQQAPERVQFNIACHSIFVNLGYKDGKVTLISTPEKVDIEKLTLWLLDQLKKLDVLLFVSHVHIQNFDQRFNFDMKTPITFINKHAINEIEFESY